MPHCPPLSAKALHPLALAAAWLAASAVAHAHDPGCSPREDPAARLACYDAEFPPSVSSEQAYREQAVSDFGQRAGSAAGPSSINQLQAGLRHLYQSRGQVVVELDNGQRWQVVDGKLPTLVTGSRLTIRKAALSGHQLLTEQGLAVRVRRLP